MAEAQRDSHMLSVIIALREEVLAQVSERLPPAARVLDMVLREVDKDQRLQASHTCSELHEPGQASAQGTATDVLQSTCARHMHAAQRHSGSSALPCGSSALPYASPD